METVGAAEGLRAERFLAAEVGPQRLRFGEAADSMHLDAQTIAPIWHRITHGRIHTRMLMRPSHPPCVKLSGCPAWRSHGR